MLLFRKIRINFCIGAIFIEMGVTKNPFYYHTKILNMRN